jgi:hypothetical protein
MAPTIVLPVAPNFLGTLRATEAGQPRFNMGNRCQGGVKSLSDLANAFYTCCTAEHC